MQLDKACPSRVYWYAAEMVVVHIKVVTRAQEVRANWQPCNLPV